MQTKIEEIYAAILPEMAANGIEDTTQNRVYALQGLLDGWKEDTDDCESPEEAVEKSMYMLALTAEIGTLEMKLVLNKIDAVFGIPPRS